MKIDRLLGIVTLLLQQDRLTAPQLAQRFEVSRRTINRDIEDLCKAGVPVVSAQGYGGGFSLAEGYKLDRSLLTREELQSLLAGLKGLGSVSGPAALDNLLDKLTPKGDRVETEDIIIDLASHYQSTLVPKLDTLKQAIRARHVVCFQYDCPTGRGARRAEPFRLVFKWSAWYLLGYCLEREDFRLFKLNRLWDLRVSEEVFSVRDLPARALDFGSRFDSGRFRLKAVFSDRARYRLIDEYGPDAFSVQADGGLLMERTFSSYDHMREWVFSFGSQVRILQPAELREERKRQAEEILTQ